MMSYSEIDQIDTLLAQPPLIADRKFSDRIEIEIRRSKTARRNIFLFTGIGWLVLMFIAASPQAIYGDLSTIVASLDIVSFYSFAANQLQVLNSSVQQLSYPTLAAGFFSLAAVLSMALRA